MLKEFQTYPFEKLNQLLQCISSPHQEIINLTIGEPQFQTPQNIQDALKNSTALLKKYPKSCGESELRIAQRDFIAQRFGISLLDTQLLPTFGTREVLFNFPQFFLYGVDSPCMAYPNPFYQVYEGSAIASKAEVILMNLNSGNHFKPSLSQKDLQRVQLVILNSPNNPTGAILTLEELQEWVKLALEYDFVILSDECYSEIYVNSPPHSILEASILAGNPSFKNILALNSISKRSCAPSLRSGFIAGDSEILKHYALYRTYLGCAMPLPLQKASIVAWQTPSEETRKIYAKNLQIAQNLFPQTFISPYSFYVWLEVGDEIQFTQRLYEKYGILVLPGSFLGREGAGSGFVRIALVYEPPIIEKSLKLIKKCLEEN